MSSNETTLLIVEPHSATRELYVRELAQTWRVLACADRRTAIDYLNTESVHAIVLEPIAPGEDNWSLLTDVRTHPATASIPVVICSVVDERRRGLELGANVYLVKPVAPQQLNREIIRWLNPHAVA